MVNGYDDPRFPDFKAQLDLGFYYVSPHSYGTTVANEFSFRLRPQFLDGQITLDQLADQTDQLIKDNIDKLIADNKWDTSKW